MKGMVGIDEVGRGCLAGPVVVAAAFVSGPIRNPKIGTLKDSKKLTKAQREAWFDFLMKNKQIDVAVAWVYPRQIEKRNISQAANLAAKRAYARLAKTASQAKGAPVFLDGGLFLGSKREQPSHAKTIVKADEKIAAVSIASIIAKVTRDRSMVRLGKKYPEYGFEAHKGYGTKFHREAIARFGILPMHRLTFIASAVQ